MPAEQAAVIGYQDRPAILHAPQVVENAFVVIALPVDHGCTQRGHRESVLIPRAEQMVLGLALMEPVGPVGIGVFVFLRRSGHDFAFIIFFAAGRRHVFANEIDLAGADEDKMPGAAFQDIDGGEGLRAGVERGIDDGVEDPRAQSLFQIDLAAAISIKALDTRW